MFQSDQTRATQQATAASGG